jgi:hypothetical protein
MQADDLILKGEQKAIDATKQTMNEGLGGDYASVGKDGKVSLNATQEQIAIMTNEQKGLYDVLKKAVDPGTTTKINVLSGDNMVIAGAYSKGKIDIADINAFGTCDEVMTKFSVLGHEINEQFEYQQGNHREYSEEGSSHMNSVKLEKTLNGGWERKGSDSKITKFTKMVVGKPGEGTTTFMAQTGVMNINYQKGNETRISTVNVELGNVVPRN